MTTVTLTLNLPDETVALLRETPASRLAGLSRFVAARLPELLADDAFQAFAVPNDELLMGPIQLKDEKPTMNMDYIAELRAIDEENQRGVSISLEEVMRRAEADSRPGFVEWLRARRVAERAERIAVAPKDLA